MAHNAQEEAYLTAAEAMRQAIHDFYTAFEAIYEGRQTATMEEVERTAGALALAMNAYEKAEKACVKARRKGRAT